MEIGFINDIGNVRKDNQDRILTLINDNSTLCCVADGMGGMDKGALASEAVTKGLSELWNSGALEDISEDEIINIIYDKISRINNRLISYSEANKIKAGTTLTVVFLKNKRAVIAHSGDTRLYLIRNGTVNQLTEDETLYNYYKKYEESRYNNPKNKSVLFSYIGKDRNLSLTMKLKDIEKNDTLIILSDGAYNYLDLYSKEIINRINKFKPQDLVDLLAEDIKKQRASDNFSIIVIKQE